MFPGTHTHSRRLGSGPGLGSPGSAGAEEVPSRQDPEQALGGGDPRPWVLKNEWVLPRGKKGVCSWPSTAQVKARSRTFEGPHGRWQEMRLR